MIVNNYIYKKEFLKISFYKNYLKKLYVLLILIILPLLISLFINNVMISYIISLSVLICQWITKPSIGRKINGYISIISSILLLAFSIYSSLYIMAIFCLLFIYMGYTEIKQKY